MKNEKIETTVIECVSGIDGEPFVSFVEANNGWSAVDFINMYVLNPYTANPMYVGTKIVSDGDCICVHVPGKYFDGFHRSYQGRPLNLKVVGCYQIEGTVFLQVKINNKFNNVVDLEVGGLPNCYSVHPSRLQKMIESCNINR